MTRWHTASCTCPRVSVGKDSIPLCKACGNSAHQCLRELKEHPSNPIPPLPADEMPGKLNLSWPSRRLYTSSHQENNASVANTQATTPTEALHHPQTLSKSDTPSDEKSDNYKHDLIYEKTLKNNEVRLIFLKADGNSVPANVTHLVLETYQDQEFPEYEAISYTWGGEDGDDTLRHPIYIGEYWDILLQTRTCCAMLSYLRPQRGVRMLWVDAICINQKNMKERASQIGKMCQIYSQCSQVVLWLGDDIVSRNSGVYPARHRFHELDSLGLSIPVQSGGANVLKQIDIRTLLKRRYFSRVWVIQELVLAPRIAIPICNKMLIVDYSMTTHVERLENRQWSWKETDAPWFQYATHGSLMLKDLPELLSLTWKGKASDARDRLYGVLGLLFFKQTPVPILPDYTISLQHMMIGMFAHEIILGKKPQVLMKAAGGATTNGMPSWMPDLREHNVWRGLSNNEQPDIPDWDSEMDWLEGVSEGMGTHNRNGQIPFFFLEEGPLPYPEKPQLYGEWHLMRFLRNAPSARENQTVFANRPWYKNAMVDAQSGALSLNLTRILSIQDLLVSAESSDKEWYRVQDPSNAHIIIYLMSKTDLGTMVKVGDELFLLDTHVSEPIYLILRNTGNHREFSLIAACAHFAFYCFVTTPLMQIPQAEAIPLADLQQSIHSELTEWQMLLEKEICRPGCTLSPFLDPLERMWDGFSLKALLPLLQGILKAYSESETSPWEHMKSVEDAFLAMIPMKYKPRIIDGDIELLFDPDERWNELTNGNEDRGWKMQKVNDKTGKFRVYREVTFVTRELESLFRTSHGLGLFARLAVRKDIRDRIMERPDDEDHFRAGCRYGCGNIRYSNGIDGSTYQVRIV